MFQLDEDFGESDLAISVIEAERNYVIQTNDFLRLDVFTNEGERIIDPNFELMQGAGINAINLQNQRSFQYLVQMDGTAKVPVLGSVYLEGLTIFEAEAKLETLFDEYYKGSFVKLQFQNKRVIVLGANGGQVIPLQNENTSLFEVIAISGGIPSSGKAHNIRLIRGNYDNPEVYLIDLGHVSSMKSSITTLQPGDIIYIEPWKRPVLQGLKDVSPFIGLFSSVLSLYFVLTNI